MTIADLGDRETHGNQICQPVKRILVELLYYANTLCIGGKKVQLLSWRAHLVVQLKGFPLSVWESLRWILISDFCILPQAALLHIVVPFLEQCLLVIFWFDPSLSGDTENEMAQEEEAVTSQF